MNKLSTILYGLLMKSSSTWSMSEDKESTAAIVNVDIVNLDVGVLVHAELVVQVVRYANQRNLVSLVAMR